MNNERHWILFLVQNKSLILDDTLSNSMFREPINKSDQTGLKQQEQFPEEELKGTQSTID